MGHRWQKCSEVHQMGFWLAQNGPKKQVGWAEALFGITRPTGRSGVDVPSLPQCQGRIHNTSGSLVHATQQKSPSHAQPSHRLVGARQSQGIGSEAFAASQLMSKDSPADALGTQSPGRAPSWRTPGNFTEGSGVLHPDSTPI